MTWPRTGNLGGVGGQVPLLPAPPPSLFQPGVAGGAGEGQYGEAASPGSAASWRLWDAGGLACHTSSPCSSCGTQPGQSDRPTEVLSAGDTRARLMVRQPCLERAALGRAIAKLGREGWWGSGWGQTSQDSDLWEAPIPLLGSSSKRWFTTAPASGGDIPISTSLDGII